jgi:hypothetical protein
MNSLLPASAIGRNNTEAAPISSEITR